MVRGLMAGWLGPYRLAQESPESLVKTGRKLQAQDTHIRGTVRKQLTIFF